MSCWGGGEGALFVVLQLQTDGKEEGAFKQNGNSRLSDQFSNFV